MDADWLGASARGDSAVRPNQLTTAIWCGPTAVPSRSYAATAPSRPAVSKLRSSCQAVHVRRPNIGASPATRSPSVTMIVWPAKATPIRPDAYADCAAKIMRVVRGPASNSPDQSEQVAVTDRGRGCFLTIVLTLTTWGMAIGLAVFLFG
jgi:hypothetical protein